MAEGAAEDEAGDAELETGVALEDEAAAALEDEAAAALEDEAAAAELEDDEAGVATMNNSPSVWPASRAMPASTVTLSARRTQDDCVRTAPATVTEPVKVPPTQVGASAQAISQAANVRDGVVLITLKLTATGSVGEQVLSVIIRVAPVTIFVP